MNINREDLFRMPWSKTDNPGAWIEVTDICNLNCPGCFRKNGLEGHKNIEDVKEEILISIEKTNCSRICISGGEPLMYPQIVEVVKFINDQKIKPIILSNGELLTLEYIKELKKAGLYQFYLHVDSAQHRQGWTGKSEAQMNELRERYARMLHKWRIKGGFNITVRKSTLHEIKDIVKWYRSNISLVSHLSLIAYRGIPSYIDYELFANGHPVDATIFSNNIKEEGEIDISTIDIYDKLEESFDHLVPCSFLPGTSKLDTYKFLIINNIGSKSRIFGEIGGRTIELYQFLHHLFLKKYDATLPSTGRSIFLLSLFDKRIRRAFANYLKSIISHPSLILERVSVQSLVIQQPFEFVDFEPNLCDGCVNLMLYQGEMINSCRLDEYRLAGGPLTFIKKRELVK